MSAGAVKPVAAGNGAVLLPYRVQLHRRGGRFNGHIDVQARCPQHAERVAVRQVIEVSYPKSKPAQWMVVGVALKGGGV